MASHVVTKSETAQVFRTRVIKNVLTCITAGVAKAGLENIPDMTEWAVEFEEAAWDTCGGRADLSHLTVYRSRVMHVCKIIRTRLSTVLFNPRTAKEWGETDLETEELVRENAVLTKKKSKEVPFNAKAILKIKDTTRALVVCPDCLTMAKVVLFQFGSGDEGMAQRCSCTNDECPTQTWVIKS
jgi:hypothetical protein